MKSARAVVKESWKEGSDERRKDSDELTMVLLLRSRSIFEARFHCCKKQVICQVGHGAKGIGNEKLRGGGQSIYQLQKAIKISSE